MYRFLPLLVVVLLVAGCGHTPPTATQQPSRLSQSVCNPAPGAGYMGVTLRCEVGALPKAAAPSGQTGIDLSNNDPSFGRWATIRKHASFVFFKVSEGTGFVDGTAARMAAEARTAGLLVGGYDFQHVCGVSATAEARLFISSARRDGLLSGPGVLPATADFELGTGCNARAWLTAWSDTVRHLTRDQVYSDPGYFGPELGCFGDADYGWVADLGGFQPLCGLQTVFHQYSWAAWDGVANVDGDVFRGTYAQLRALAREPQGSAAQKHHELVRLYKYRKSVRAVIRDHRCPVYRIAGPKCRTWRSHGRQANSAIAGLHARHIY